MNWKFFRSRYISGDRDSETVSNSGSSPTPDFDTGHAKLPISELTLLDVPIQEDFDPDSKVRRGLRTRHVSMIALAGIIGPGLLVGSGQALNSGGPAALIIGFGVIGFIAAFVIMAIGEMSTLYPTNGGFVTHTDRFVNKAAGFVCGWNYFVIWIMVLANEYNAISSVMSTWSTKVPIYGYFLLFWFAFSVFQMLEVGWYGEAEFYGAIIKITFLLGYFIFSIIYMSGGVKDRPAFGFHYWNDPGAFSHGFAGVANVFVFCSTFYAGTESVAVTATESRSPGQAVPRAVRQIFIRIVFIYMGSALFYGATCPWNAPALLHGKAKALQSPMTVALQNAGWSGGYHLINAFLLVTCISAVNSSVYLGGRTLKYMAESGAAPKFFKKTLKNGVPAYAMFFTNLFGFLSLMNIDSGAAEAYNYIVNLSGVSTFISWGIICLAHLRFRRAWNKQGHSVEDLPFRAKIAPWSSVAGLVLNVFLALIQGWSTFVPFNAGNFVDAYILLPVSALAYCVWAVWTKRWKWYKPTDINLAEGRRNDLDARPTKSAWYLNF